MRRLRQRHLIQLRSRVGMSLAGPSRVRGQGAIEPALTASIPWRSDVSGSMRRMFRAGLHRLHKKYSSCSYRYNISMYKYVYRNHYHGDYSERRRLGRADNRILRDSSALSRTARNCKYVGPGGSNQRSALLSSKQHSPLSTFLLPHFSLVVRCRSVTIELLHSVHGECRISVTVVGMCPGVAPRQRGAVQNQSPHAVGFARIHFTPPPCGPPWLIL